MIIMKGEKLKNKVSCDLFTVKEVDDSKVVMLEDEKGICAYLAPNKRPRLFFREDRMDGTLMKGVHEREEDKSVVDIYLTLMQFDRAL